LAYELNFSNYFKRLTALSVFVFIL